MIFYNLSGKMSGMTIGNVVVLTLLAQLRLAEASTPPAFSSSSKPSVETMIMSTPTVALVSTYPPTLYELATFTSNLSVAIPCQLEFHTVVVRIMDRAEADAHEEVVAQWITGDRASLRRAVTAIESSDAVVLQRPFKLSGGPDSEGMRKSIEVVRVLSSRYCTRCCPIRPLVSGTSSNR